VSNKMRLPAMEKDPDFQAILRACDRLLATKGNDYKGAPTGDADRDRLGNFYRAAEKHGTSPFLVLAVYLGKHLEAIDAFVRNGQAESEPIDGRIQDVINYLLLLGKMVRHERRVRERG
jgi:hypothetical protein